VSHPALAALDWEALALTIATNGITLDRPRFSGHPAYPDIVYPLDYGYVNDTVGLDGEELDIFVGTAPTGLVGACYTTDRRKGDNEIKLLYDCDAAEVYMAHGFLNFAPALLSAELRLRTDMATLWRAAPPGGGIDHIEVYVSDLVRSGAFYAELLTHLGYRPYQRWDHGLSYRKGPTYIVIVQVEEGHRLPLYNRRRVGLNHLAFTATSKEAVDTFYSEWLGARHITPLYGGVVDDAKGSYAVFFEDPDRIKLEVVYRPDTRKPTAT
jgi:inorganic pyrophosphatase